MSRFVPFVLLLALSLPTLLAGCAQTPGGQGETDRGPDAPPISGPGNGEASSALGLVNLWRVSGAKGEEAETWLRLDVPEFQLWRDCGMIMGSWQATESLFLASIHGASGDCVTDEVPRVAWLESVDGYHAVDEGRELTDADGSVVATLTVDGAPEPHCGGRRLLHGAAGDHG